MIAESVGELIIDDVFIVLADFVPGVDTYLKLEGLNPAGSVKLKTAVALVESVTNAGRLRPGTRLIESTSGNLGIALSMVCADRGIPLTVVTDPNANRQSIKTMTALGSDVVEVTRRDSNGGYLKTRIDYIVERLAREPELVWLNQYGNDANPGVHRDRTSRALHNEFGDIDYLFVGVGTSGTLMGCLEYFAEHSPGTRVYGVDSIGSVTFGAPAGRRHLPGLGSSRRPEIYRADADFVRVLVPESEAVALCRELAVERGLLLGGSTGTVLAAVRRLRAELRRGSTVVAISPDFGDRYLDTLYSDDWVAGRFPSIAEIPPAAA